MLGVPLRHLFGSFWCSSWGYYYWLGLECYESCYYYYYCIPFKLLLGFVLFAMKRAQKATWASKRYTCLGYL